MGVEQNGTAPEKRRRRGGVPLQLGKTKALSKERTGESEPSIDRRSDPTAYTAPIHHGISSP